VATDPDYEELRAAVSNAEMWPHLEVFERHHKEAGSPGEWESINYVEQVMRRYGYATDLILHDAYISLPGKASVVAGNQVFEAITHSHSQPSTGLTAPVVDLRGGDETAFAAADLRGKIAMIDSLANPVMTRRAMAAGAIGQLHVSPHQYRHEMCISPVWGSPGERELSRMPSTVVVTVAAADGAALRARLAGDPGMQVTLNAEVDTGWRPTPILIADLPGPDGSTDSPFIFFTGHHDAWYEGVMDNGGANATMMEVARLCATKRGRWKRGLRLAFWSGHSQGRYSSSAWYADANWEELEKRALVHVNVDSTGGLGNTMIDTGSAPELRGLARESIEREVTDPYKLRRVGRAGDESFWGIGVPAMYGNLSAQPPKDGGTQGAHGTGWWWHTAHDRIDKMDGDILVRDTRIYLHSIWRLVTDEVLPIDFSEHARSLRAELTAIQEGLGDRFDLSLLIDRAGALEARCAALRGNPEKLNAVLTALCRILVPVESTEGDRFLPDAAVPQQTYPSLQPLRRLAQLPRGSEAARFLEVDMVRARARVAFALAQAIATADAALA
jgi:N-acetylated-alpha-linked acidic dipeptidase